jgi:hypothetical protein
MKTVEKKAPLKIRLIDNGRTIDEKMVKRTIYLKRGEYVASDGGEYSPVRKIDDVWTMDCRLRRVAQVETTTIGGLLGDILGRK